MEDPGGEVSQEFLLMRISEIGRSQSAILQNGGSSGFTQGISLSSLTTSLFTKCRLESRSHRNNRAACIVRGSSERVSISAYRRRRTRISDGKVTTISLAAETVWWKHFIVVVLTKTYPYFTAFVFCGMESWLVFYFSSWLCLRASIGNNLWTFRVFDILECYKYEIRAIFQWFYGVNSYLLHDIYLWISCNRSYYSYIYWKKIVQCSATMCEIKIKIIERGKGNVNN